MIDSLPERITSKIWPEPNSGCWLWSGALSCATHGYGVTSYPDRSRQALAHRLVFEHVKGPIPIGMHVLHRCDNPPCCNPAHLFLGTPADNMRDMVKKGRQQRGATHYRTKVTDVMVVEMREAYAAGESQSSIAVRLGVSVTSVCLICKAQRWAHVGGPTNVDGNKRRSRRGAANYNAKLTLEQVDAIRSISGPSIADISRQFGVSKRTGSNVIKRRTWQ